MTGLGRVLVEDSQRLGEEPGHEVGFEIGFVPGVKDDGPFLLGAPLFWQEDLIAITRAAYGNRSVEKAGFLGASGGTWGKGKPAAKKREYQQRCELHGTSKSENVS